MQWGRSPGLPIPESAHEPACSDRSGAPTIWVNVGPGRVRELTRRTRGVSTERMVEELTRYVRGWLGYYGKCDTPSVPASLERWVRRRLRSAMWKQWQRGRVRFGELTKRGVSCDLAARTAGSADGPWRLARSPALAIALPNAYFDRLGLPRLTVCR